MSPARRSVSPPRLQSSSVSDCTAKPLRLSARLWWDTTISLSSRAARRLSALHTETPTNGSMRACIGPPPPTSADMPRRSLMGKCEQETHSWVNGVMECLWCTVTFINLVSFCLNQLIILRSGMICDHACDLHTRSRWSSVKHFGWRTHPRWVRR